MHSTSSFLIEESVNVVALSTKRIDKMVDDSIKPNEIIPSHLMNQSSSDKDDTCDVLLEKVTNILPSSKSTDFIKSFLTDGCGISNLYTHYELY